MTALGSLRDQALPRLVRLEVQVLAQQAVLGEQLEVAEGHQLVPVVASAAGPGQLTQQVGVAKDERSQERPVHGLIMREIDLEAVRDLLWAPRLGPTPVLAATVAPTDPPHLGACHQLAIGDEGVEHQSRMLGV